MELGLSLLAQLHAFETVGRHGSFKRAADELHVTPSALSHHVRRLEAALGIQLVRRLHRRIELTPEGRQLAIDCAGGFGALAAAVRRLTRRIEDDALTVSVAPYFSARWLTPRLGRWWARHPEIDLQLRHAYQPADFLHDRVHAGISWGDGTWPGVEAVRVLDGVLAAVCSLGLLQRLPPSPKPADLLGSRLFCEFDAAHWSRWFENAGVRGARGLDVVRIDDSHALRRTAIDGHGFALFFRGLLDEDLRSGQLVKPFDVDVDPGSAYFFVRPRGPLGRNVAAFAEWLMDEVAENPFA